ncbi:MAG: recombinase family protein [Planctomyces sp.]|nr:recombinase family protein [Planctomyces sp.]
MSCAAIGYVRVSTEGQAVDGVSLDAQRARIEAWCLANDVVLTAVFVDAGVSGKRADNRPELQRAISAVTRQKGILIVYSLSRLARSTKDTIVISEQLDKAGADLVSLSEKIDTTSAAGKMVFRMLAVLAEFERDLVSERTSAALQHKRSQGKRVGTIPFGYELSADHESLSPVSSEQQTIGLMKGLRENGLSYEGIADELNSLGIRPKGNGPRWYGKTVMNILKRRPTVQA